MVGIFKSETEVFQDDLRMVLGIGADPQED